MPVVAGNFATMEPKDRYETYSAASCHGGAISRRRQRYQAEISGCPEGRSGGRLPWRQDRRSVSRFGKCRRRVDGKVGGARERVDVLLSGEAPGARGHQEATHRAVELRKIRRLRKSRESLFLLPQFGAAKPVGAGRDGFAERTGAGSARSEEHTS